jgi:hypothetical protein
MTLLFVLGRVTAPQGLASVGAYHPAPSLEAYLAHGYHFLRETFCRAGWFSPPVAALLMLALAAAAWKWRSRLLTLCLVWMVTGILPLAFIPLRGLAAAYIPTFALALFAAAAYVRLTRARWPATAAVLLAVVALQIWRGPLDYTPITQTGRQIAALEAEIRASHLRLREDMRILILRDPFPDDDWSSTFFLQLASRTHGLSVRRLDHLLREPAASETLDFDLVLTYVDGRLHHCESAPFRRAPIASIEDLARNAACRPLAPSARAPRRPAPIQIHAAAEPSFAAAR